MRQKRRRESPDRTLVLPDTTTPEKAETWFTFTMKRGANSEPVINKESSLNASSRDYSSQQFPAVKEQNQMIDMMASFLNGEYIDLDLEVDGKIARSDASFLSGNRIVLYSMDFDRLPEQREIVLGRYEGLSDRAFMSKAGKDSGIRFETKDRVSVFVK
jgi:hypothetical protein